MGDDLDARWEGALDPRGKLLGIDARLRCDIDVADESLAAVEALELIEILEQRFDRRPDLAVVNQLYPKLPAGFEARDALGRLWKSRRELNDEELARFTESWNGPLGELPLYPLERGPDLVAELADGLSPWLEGVPA